MRDDKLYAMRHSFAHITAAAVQRLWPAAKFGVGPVVEDGFYYDIKIDGQSISEQDFPKIEKMMRRIIKERQTFDRREVTYDEAVAWANEIEQPFKLDLINDIKTYGTTDKSTIDAMQGDVGSDTSVITLYSNGSFTDLCRGPHVANTSEVGAFKLIRVAGAYWRGDESQPQMQRLYGVAFDTQEELDAYIYRVEEAKRRDHRKLGRELDLYTTSDLVGVGLPLFTPRGTVLRDMVASLSNELRQSAGFQKVWTPHITKKDLYEKSGHWAKFGDELFLVESQETSDKMALKPMNCPHHTQIYSSSPRSYRDLPIRYLETTTDYRDEKTGELGGLSRVRSLTQDDSHVFCMPEQIEGEIDQLLKSAIQLYKTIGMDLSVRLSYRDDSGGYLGSDDLWETAQKQLRDAVVSSGFEFTEVEGEAAFYGPKIDFMATDAIGRRHQVATVQLDFVQPSRFELKYAVAGGGFETPVMIHCALLGSIERFLSVFIEHTAGWFPFWAAPEQVRILMINDEVADYVDDVRSILDNLVLSKPVKFNEIRYSVDSRSESLGKKIREANSLKVPVMLIVGPKDVEARQVSVRTQLGEEKVALNDLSRFLVSLD